MIDAESAVDDIELYELQHSIEDEMIQEGMVEEEEVEVEEADPVEPNRGEKYVAQGKKTKQFGGRIQRKTRKIVLILWKELEVNRSLAALKIS